MARISEHNPLLVLAQPLALPKNLLRLRTPDVHPTPHAGPSLRSPCGVACIDARHPVILTGAPRQTPLPHLHRDWAHPCHICDGTGLTPATSAPGLGSPCCSPLPHLHRD